MPPHLPTPVTPLVALIFGRAELYALALGELEKLFGPCELESPTFAFDKTHYYEPELGLDLKRRFITFERLADPALLAEWKLTTNALEHRFAREHGAPASSLASTIHYEVGQDARATKRCVNLDPGYLTGAKLVLASTKDFAHRIYLRDGIFAEITLRFSSGQWIAHEFTFPDFKAPDYHVFLSQARVAHLRKTRHFPPLTLGNRSVV